MINGGTEGLINTLIHTLELILILGDPGLLAGTMQYFDPKFTSRAEEPLGTYSYRTSSRSGRIPSC